MLFLIHHTVCDFFLTLFFFNITSNLSKACVTRDIIGAATRGISGQRAIK